MLFKYFVLMVIVSTCLAGKKYMLERKIHQEYIDVTCGNKTVKVAHFTATNTKNESDIIHYVISGQGRPTIIIKHVFKKLEVSIDNDSFCAMKNQSLLFNGGKNEEYSGIILSKVFPFVDKKDQIYLPSSNNDIFYKNNIAKDFVWKIDEDSSVPGSSQVVKLLGTSENVTGSLDFSVTIHNKEGNAETLPGYPLGANISEFRFNMAKLPSTINNKSPDNLRYAVEAVFFTANVDLKKVDFKTEKSIDDEHTPGTFKIWAVTLPLKTPKEMHHPQTYALWKPVAYRTPVPTMDSDAFAYNNIWDGKVNSMMPKHTGSFNNLPNSLVDWTLAHADDITYYGVNVTFGQSKDGGYVGSKYVTWSGMIGSGKPPLDTKLSDFVITVITIGLGGPAIGGILIGILVGLIRRLRGSNSSKSKYDQIN